MKRLLLLLLFSLIIIPSVMGEEQGFVVQSECLDANTLHEYITFNISGSSTTIDAGNVTCPYGCDSNRGKYGADCMEFAQMDYFRYDFLAVWGVIFIFLAWYWQRGWKKVASILIAFHGIAGLFITTHPIMFTPVVASILLLLWSWGVIKPKGEWFK